MHWRRLGLSVVVLTSLVVACADDNATTPTAKKPAPKFGADVAPLFMRHCALTACHGSKESSQFFYMTTDTNQIYSELMKPSPTCNGWKFIEPGKPEKSLVMVKMDGEQSTLPEACTSARRSEMPPGDPPGSDSELLLLELRDVVRAWIKAGAKKD